MKGSDHGDTIIALRYYRQALLPAGERLPSVHQGTSRNGGSLPVIDLLRGFRIISTHAV
jgi:hypothetical protein